MTNAFEHESDLLLHKEQPKNTSELQALLMEEYFLENHLELTLEEFLGPKKNEYELAMAKEWASSGLAAKFRHVIDDPKNADRQLDITLDEVKLYS